MPEEKENKEMSESKARKKTAEAHGSVAEQTPEEASKKMIDKKIKEEDEFAEKPEEVLTEAELKELEELKKAKKEPTEQEKRDKERRRRRGELTQAEITEGWMPKTKLGVDVKAKRVKDIDQILDENKKILEPEIVDTLLKLKSDLILIGQSKGKFGGGKRRAWRQTQRKTKEGNVPTFAAMAVAGDSNGHIGVGVGRASETLPARDKSIRKAKLNIMKIDRACSAVDCDCDELHTVPFKVEGKSGSVIVTLIPAPQGTGLVAAKELRKVLALCGIEDVYSRTTGKQRTTFNLIKACIEALKKTTTMEVNK